MAKVLTQEDLAELYSSQQNKDWLKIQESQLDLKETLIDNYKKNWERFSAEHPHIKPIFDLDKEEAQEFVVSKEIAEKYNLEGHLKEFDKKSDNSTAGIRAFVDILHSENPSMMYNDLFMALLIIAEAEFLEKVHEEIRLRLNRIEEADPGFEKFIIGLKKKIRACDLKIIEEIYEKPIEEILPFVRDNIVKLVGGEVRPHTAKFVALEARLLAQRGITTLTAEKFDDSIPIYMHSFLSFLLGATGATNYTSSHSSNYVCGRKVLAIGGGQLLPDSYESYRTIIKRIIEKEIVGGTELILKISSADSKFIKRTLTYNRMAALYKSVLNVTQEDVEMINKAHDGGHQIILSSLNGSTWKTLSIILDNLGIDRSVFKHVYEDENPFFDVGYVINKEVCDDRDMYSIDHLGVDITMTKVANTVPYSKLVGGGEIGQKIYECDPDSDRFCVKQIVEKSDTNLGLVKEFGIDYYDLDSKTILVAPSPNKMFLLLDVADYERMRDQGTWDNYYSIYAITYVSTRAWAEFGDSVPGMVKVMTRVGFKNLTEIQQAVEKWYFAENGGDAFTFEDQLGAKVNLDRKRQIRIHAKSEESGGRVAGMNNDCYNIFGEKTLAMPEKSAPDSLLSELTLSSKLYLEAGGKMDGEYQVLRMMEAAFKQYGLLSKIDSRLDILHGDQGKIALMHYKDQQEALEYASKVKSNFNNFFFSLGRAFKNKEATLEQIREILTKTLPSFDETWSCLESLTLTEEPLSNGRTRPEGVPMSFRSRDGFVPLVTELDFRPSGTDPLKSKVYTDAIKLTSKEKMRLEAYFSVLPEYDLFEILEKYKIKSIEDPSTKAEGLMRLELGKGPEIK